MKTFSDEFLDSLVLEASRSDRRRHHLNLHQSFDDKCQRLFNAISLDSYITPHRHSLAARNECLIAVKGLFAAVIFTDDGEIKEVAFFGTEKYESVGVGLELCPDSWHTVVALEQGSILFEVKEGPFDPAKAKEFAPWAPSEDSIGALDYLNHMREICAQWLKYVSDE